MEPEITSTVVAGKRLYSVEIGKLSLEEVREFLNNWMEKQKKKRG